MNDQATYFSAGIIGKQRSRDHQRVYTSEIYAKLMDPEHGERITELRRLAAIPETPENVLSELKKGLPAVVWQSLFPEGLDRAQKNVEAATGFVPIDIDAKDNPGVDLTQMKAQIAELAFVEGTWISPKGAGLHGVARVRLTDQKLYGRAAGEITGIIETATGLKLDHAMLDSIQALYLSYDPEAILKDDHEIVPYIPTPTGLSLALGPALYQACHSSDQFRDRSAFATRLGGHIAAGEIKQNDPWVEQAIDAICKTSEHPTDCRRKLEESIEYGKSTYKPEKRGKSSKETEDARALADVEEFSTKHTIWSTSVFSEKGEKPTFYIEQLLPYPHFEEIREQQLLQLAGKQKEPRSYDSKFLYYLSKNAPVQGPPVVQDNKKVNTREGIFDFRTGIMELWDPQQKILGHVPCTYIPKDKRLVPKDNRVDQFWMTFGKDVYQKMKHWAFSRVVAPEPGNANISCIGGAGCGKTKAVIGTWLVGMPSFLSMETIEKDQHEMVAFIGSFVNIDDEVDTAVFKGCTKMKLIASRTEFQVNPKHRAPFLVRNNVTPFSMGNRQPFLPDIDEAVLDRYIGIHFHLRFRYTTNEIKDLEAHLDAIPQFHWDCYWSDCVDIWREGKYTSPNRELMIAEYHRLRDSFYLFCSSTKHQKDGVETSVGDLVDIYQDDQRERARRALRSGKPFEKDERGIIKLREKAQEFLRHLGLEVYRKPKDHQLYVRNCIFLPESLFAEVDPDETFDFPEETWTEPEKAEESFRQENLDISMESEELPQFSSNYLGEFEKGKDEESEAGMAPEKSSLKYTSEKKREVFAFACQTREIPAKCFTISPEGRQVLDQIADIKRLRDSIPERLLTEKSILISTLTRATEEALRPILPGIIQDLARIGLLCISPDGGWIDLPATMPTLPGAFCGRTMTFQAVAEELKALNPEWSPNARNLCRYWTHAGLATSTQLDVTFLPPLGAENG